MTLEEYKNILVSYHRNIKDSAKEKYNERISKLEKEYTNDLLNKILKDTNLLIDEILSLSTDEMDEYSVSLDAKHILAYIDLGSGYADKVYKDEKGRYLSLRMLNEKFGYERVYLLKDERYYKSENEEGYKPFYQIRFSNISVEVEETLGKARIL